jgi:hypothetical protein
MPGVADRGRQLAAAAGTGAPGAGPSPGHARSSWSRACSARSPPGSPTAEGRIRAARLPARKALEDFDFDYQRSLKREVITHLGTLDRNLGAGATCLWARVALAGAAGTSGAVVRLPGPAGSGKVWPTVAD